MDILLRHLYYCQSSLVCLELTGFILGIQLMACSSFAHWDACFWVKYSYIPYSIVVFIFKSLGQIIDIILIATQTVKPADGSNYIMNYFGPRLTPVQLDNETYRIPQPDWHEL